MEDINFDNCFFCGEESVTYLTNVINGKHYVAVYCNRCGGWIRTIKADQKIFNISIKQQHDMFKKLHKDYYGG